MLEFINEIKTKRHGIDDILDSIYEAHKLIFSSINSVDMHFLHYPPGHYYSPLPSRQEFQSISKRVYNSLETPEGVDLNEREQLKLYARLVKWYDEFPFTDEPQKSLRYYFNNSLFCHSDAYWLYSMIREFRPRQIIEVGSGFSSAVMLDTNELFLDNSIKFTFIEPYPDRLLSILRSSDQNTCNIHKDIVQNISTEIFAELQAGDFLFIDSSHVVKIGSDVLHLIKNVLPALKPGVIIHFHDIFYPFEYPKNWLERGVAWNECYFLNAFLQYNTAFAIKLFGNYLGKEHQKMLHKHTPVCMKNIGGSLWLEKSQ